VFSRALELKVEEFKNAATQMDVDIKAALLYDLGFQRETQLKVKKSNQELELKLKALEEQFTLVETSNEELTLIKTEQTQSLIELERQNIDLERQNEGFKVQVESLRKDM